MVVLDDAEVYEKNDFSDFLMEILKHKMQAIIVIRRSEWFDEKYGKIEKYYRIKNGEIKKLIECTEKNVTSVNQLKNMFLQGAFDN